MSSADVGQGVPRSFQLVLFNTREHSAICIPLEVFMQAFCPSGVFAPLLLQVQSSPAKAGAASIDIPKTRIKRTIRNIIGITSLIVKSSG